MRTFILAAASLAVVSATPVLTPAPAFAQDAVVEVATGDFIKKQKSIKGGWEIVEQNGQTVIRFDDDFRAKKGPDLKVFLSPKSVSDVTGKTATDGALLISALTSNKGGQTYVIPEGTDLSAYSSVLVHCEEYSVLWGGGDL